MGWVGGAEVLLDELLVVPSVKIFRDWPLEVVDLITKVGVADLHDQDSADGGGHGKLPRSFHQVAQLSAGILRRYWDFGKSFGAPERSRTPDLRITSALLYQLSYKGVRRREASAESTNYSGSAGVAGRGGRAN